MEINDTNIKRASILSIVLILAILVFFLVKPILLSIIGGLVLAYVFFPVYKFLSKRTNSKNLSASITSVLAILVIIIPLYFIIPIMIRQIFALFEAAQTIDIQIFLQSIFPTAAESFIIQATLAIKNAINGISSTVINTLVSFLIEIPKIMFNLAIVAFVFFFTLRDFEKLAEFASILSPLNKVEEKKLVQQFKDITNSIVYGQVIVGFIQGIIAGIGFFVFGIPGALVLSILAVALSVIPLLGSFLVWIPAAIYLYTQGDIVATIFFLVYNIILVSNIDNVLKIYLVSKKANLSPVIVLIGMVGGLLIFGILGLLIGPLILAYFITFLNAYKENTLSSLFK